MFRGLSRNSKRRSFPHKGTELLPPRLNRTFYIRNRYPFIDLDGSNTSITRVTGSSPIISLSDYYQLTNNELMKASVGFNPGVDHWAYNADGTPKTILGSELIENGVGYQFYCGDKGVAGYSQAQDAVSNTRIIRALRVHTYIDTLYFADHQEMDWSETNE